MTWTILQADARQIPLKDKSVQTVVTSPPYWGLRDYGVDPSVWGGQPDCVHEWGDRIEVNATNHTDKRRWNHTRNGRDELQPIEKRVAWLRTPVSQGQICHLCGAWFGALGLEPTPELFVEHIVQVFREVWRVLKDDGTIWVNLGDCYATGAGKVGNSPGGGEQGECWKGFRGDHPVDLKRNGAAIPLGPMTQPNRMPIAGLKPKNLIGIPWRVAFALQADGWYLRSDIIWSKPNPMPESVTDRPTKAHEYIFLLSKKERYYFDQEAVKEPITCERMRGSGPMTNRNDSDSRGDYRLRTNGKHDKTDPQSSGRRMAESVKTARANGAPHDHPFGLTRNIRTVWEIATQPFPEAHFATFPEELAKRCIKAGSQTGDIILDPFGGAGTTILVADKLHRHGIGLELKFDYCAMARRRCFDDAPLLATR